MRVEGPRGTATTTLGSQAPAGAPAALPPADLESALMALEHEARATTANLAEQRSETAKADRDRAAEAARKAEADARAAESRGGFWGKLGGVAKVVATVAAVVGGAAATVFSAGTAAPAVVALCGLALSMSSPYIGKACGKTAGDVAAWTGVAASLIGGGAGALASTGTRQAALAVTVQVGARTVEGTARATEGAATIAEKRAAAEAIDRQADAAAARVALTRANHQLDEVVELLREVEASARRALGTVHTIVEERTTRQRALSLSRIA